MSCASCTNLTVQPRARGGEDRPHTLCGVAAALHTALYRVGYVSLTTGNVLDMYKAIAWELGLPTQRSRATAYRAIQAETTRLVCEAKQAPRARHRRGAAPAQ